MRETKRILLSPKLWGLLALLLAFNLVLLVAQDIHMDGFYPAYRKELQTISDLPFADAQAQETAELERLQAVGTLRLWQSEENGELKSMLREACIQSFGADFESKIESGAIDLSEDALHENYLRRDVLQALLDQLAHLQEYPAYLQQVQANSKQMAALSIFNKPNSFSSRNIEKTAADFPTTVDLQLDNDFAVTMLVTDQLGGYTLLIFTLFLTLQFLDERKRGLWSLVHGSAEGRSRLARKRAGILLLGVTLGTLVLLGGKLLFGVIQYGSIGSLSRNVQSIAVFSDFPWVMPVWAFLLGYFLLKVLGMWLVGMAVWAILQAVNHLPLALGAACIVLASEYALFRFIPDSYTIVFLRYVNLFALVDVPQIALHYLNLNLFGWPVQGFLLAIGLIPPLLAVLFAANLLLAAKKKPVSRQNSLLSWFDRLRVPFSKAVGRLRLFGMELYKILWLQKGILVLLLVALFSFAAMDAPQPDQELYNSELAGLSASMQGPITEETLRLIDSKIEEYSAWAPSETVLRQLGLLQQMREKVTQSLEAKDGLWLIDPTPYAALMGQNNGRYQRQNAVVLLLALALLLSGTFAAEQQDRMQQLLRGSPHGSARLWGKKIGVALLLTVVVWLIFEAGELTLLHKTYGTFALSAPLQSFDAFAQLPYHTTLGAAIAAYLLLRLLALCAVTGVILTLSAVCKQTNAAILLNCAVLVLPACLSYMNITALDFLSFVKPLSPLETSAAGYILIAASCIFLCILSNRIWKMRKAS